MTPILPPSSSGYREPAADVTALVDAATTPRFVLRPDGQQAVLAAYSALPSIADVAQPFERLAGLRLDARRHATRRTRFFADLVRLDLETGRSERGWGEAPPKVISLAWSPTGRHIATLHWTDDDLELWVLDVEHGRIARVASGVNEAVGPGYVWCPGGQALIAALRPAGQGPLPERSPVPYGPTIEDTAGRKATHRTFQDLLHDEIDAARFERLATVQLVRIDVATGVQTPLGAPSMTIDFEPSPDDRRVLVHTLRRPFSYELPYYRFPRIIEVLDRRGRREVVVAEQPLADEIPIGGVRSGIRSVAWHPQRPSTLLWWEALDEGDPEREVPHRDRLLAWDAPFQETPRELVRTEHRLRGVSWTEAEDQAIVREFDRDRRWTTARLHDMSGRTPPSVLWDRSIRDVYGDEGDPIYVTRPDGTRVIRLDGDAILLAGAGASPSGERPFLDRRSLVTGQTQRLFESADDAHEVFVDVVGDPRQLRWIIRRETPTEPPNYWRVSPSAREPVTAFPDPHPQLTGIEKRILTYPREDGVMLSGTLYLPPGAEPGVRLPLVVWAYPIEFNDSDTASQVHAAPRRFTRLAGTSPLMFLTQGYAVLDAAAMPIVGDPETMNDTFIDQVVASAQAAVDAVVAEGVADRERVAVAGHSYGAFMVANLLAHSELFRAGIARSGAYNRTLTPFGFQSERRTLWTAPETYVKVSPLFAADRIKTPLLLVHGELDPNPGTYPMQTERLYQAIAGTGGTARMVLLPHESHGYAARESVLHVLAESFEWLDRHLKSPEK